MNEYGSSNVSVRLALANIKKKKKNIVTATLFIMIAAMMLSSAVMLANQLDDFFYKMNDVQNLPDLSTFVSRSKYRDEFEEFFQSDPRTTGFEKEFVLYLPDAEHKTVNLQVESYIMDMEAERTILTPIFTDGFSPDECEANGINRSEAIYIPSQFAGAGGSIGKDYTVSAKGAEYHFTLAGYYDSAVYATANTGNIVFFVTNECFEKLRGTADEAYFLKATIKEGCEGSKQLVVDFKDKTSISSVMSGLYSMIFSSASIKENIQTNVGVGVAVLVLTGIAVMAAVLVVICSEISENIRDSYQDIGVLEAMGCFSKQIAASYLIQYGLAAVIGSVIGSLLSVFLCNALSTAAFTGLLGFHVNISADPIASLAGILITAFSCMICVLFPIAKIRKCTILTALRGGIETHSFKRSSFPLHKGSNGINTRIGFKNLFTEKKQNFMIGSVVFLCMVLFGLSVSIYNTFKDINVMLNNCGLELSDLQAVAAEGADTGRMIDEITSLPEFRKAFCSEQTSLTVDGNDITSFVTADYSLPENINIFEGEAPVYENEIVLGENLCTILGKGIGDKVKVSYNGASTECYITGKCYIAINGGKGCYANESLLKLLKSDYKIQSIDLYFSEGVTEEQAIAALSRKYKIADREKLERLTGGSIDENTSDGKYSEAERIAEEKIALLLAEHGFTDISYSVVLDGKVILSGSSESYRIKRLENFREKLSANLAGPAAAFFAVAVMVLVVSLLLTAGILSMMVRNRVNKKKAEFGIFKAMGYTASDLMKQNALSYAVSAFIGAAVGVITVLTTARPILDAVLLLLLGSRVPAAIDSALIIGSGAAMVIFVFAFAMLCSRKIKNISVYSLMTE